MCQADTEYQNVIYKCNGTMNSPPDLEKKYSYYFEVLCGTFNDSVLSVAN